MNEEIDNKNQGSGLKIFFIKLILRLLNILPIVYPWNNINCKAILSAKVVLSINRKKIERIRISKFTLKNKYSFFEIFNCFLSKKNIQKKGIFKKKPGQFDSISGDISKIDEIEFIDQNPIGTSSRSNPVTYLKIYDDIRNLYSSLKLSKLNNYKAKHFSFNVDGGRCENCKGEGNVKIEMQFMADVSLVCENCKGKRFKLRWYWKIIFR